MSLATLPYLNILKEFDPLLDETATVQRVNSVIIQSICYSKSACVVASVEDLDSPQFYQLCEFIVSPPPPPEVLFVCTQMVYECYLAHYHAYKVNATNVHKIVGQKELHDFHPLQCVTLPESHHQVVITKYHLFAF